jgi:hypothetical protein
MAGRDIAACTARLDTFAPQHPGGDRLAVRQNLIRAEGRVAGADNMSALPGRE